MTACEARDIAKLTEMSPQWVELSIRSLIFHESLSGKLHCDWYSSRLYELTESDISNVSDILSKLEVEKYHCRMKVFEPTKDFHSRVIRLHISWESWE